jgi:hypothetical protein
MRDADASDPEEAASAMADSFARAMEEGMAAQSAFVDQWIDTIEDASDAPDDGFDGALRAYEIWMETAESEFDRVRDAVEADESVDVEAVRDAWLTAANEAASEVLQTDAFAAATGEAVADALEARTMANEQADAAIHSLGLPTEDDVAEVGRRLVELERRQQSVEDELRRLRDAVEE